MRAMSDSLTPEVRALLILQLVPGLGPRLTASLLNHLGSAQAVLTAPPAQLREVPLIGPKLIDAILSVRRQPNVERELELLHKHGVHLLACRQPDYPSPLNDIFDPPPLLYVRGEVRASDTQAVALVGTRHPTEYGRRMATRLATDLVRAGYVVVSGLARGIDGLAHKAALEAGGRTLAVLAGGLSRIYPPEHKDLAQAVSASGALLSEATMEQAPLPAMFPARNRIISGLSRAVVLVEAAEQSGALITATHAAEQGKSVLAVPGSVESEQSGGCHALLRQGAVLCRGLDDILEELQGITLSPPVNRPSKTTPAPPVSPPVPTGPPPGLNEAQLQVWAFLSTGARHLDEMVQQLGLSVATLSGMLLLLEMKKVVRRLPGNRYERC